MTDSGDTTPGAQPAAGPPPAPPAPPALPIVPPAVPPYAFSGGSASTPPGRSPLPYPTPQYPNQPAYAPPQWQETAAQGSAAARAYAPPQGYAPPPQGYGPYTPPRPPAPIRSGSTLGVVAFAFAVTAAIGATILGSIAGFNVGLGTGREIALRPMDIDFDWSILAPVREWVLLGELAFWGGTVLGIWAIVQGIIAIVKNRGRGWGIAAVIVAAIGPIAFATGVQAFLAAGFASGASIGG